MPWQRRRSLLIPLSREGHLNSKKKTQGSLLQRTKSDPLPVPKLQNTKLKRLHSNIPNSNPYLHLNYKIPNPSTSLQHTRPNPLPAPKLQNTTLKPRSLTPDPNPPTQGSSHRSNYPPAGDTARTVLRLLFY